MRTTCTVTVDVEVIEGPVVTSRRRAVGEGDATAVEARVRLPHGADVDGAAAEPWGKDPPHASAPAVRQLRPALTAVPRKYYLALK